MRLLAAEPELIEPIARAPAAAMLAELDAAQNAVLAAIRTMERATRGQFGGQPELSGVRFRLSHASFQRRLLVERIRKQLVPLADACDRESFRSLAAKQFEYTRRSNAHVSRWTSAAISRDWTGYCAASRELRRELAQTIEAECSILHPLLKRLRS
jgi:hypothetical protein